MRVLVCGSRDWLDVVPIAQRLASLPKDTTIVHGGCRGADKLAGEVAKDFNFKVEVYLANWRKYGKAAGIIRNSQMINSGIQLVIAFHENLVESKGTRDTMKKAGDKRIPVEVIR